MTYDKMKEDLAGLHGEKAKKDMEDFLATPHPIERDEFTLRGSAKDYKVTTVKGNPWDCNVSIPADTPREINNWLRDTGY